MFEHPVNEKNTSTNRKNTSESREKKKQKKKDNCNEITNRNNNNENRDNKNKTNVYILGNSMVKKLNRYLLTKKIRSKHLVKVRSFPGGGIQLYDGPCETKFTKDKPKSYCFTCRHNNLRTENTVSQIAKAVIDLATSLKNDGNIVTVSGIVQWLDELNSKENEVNCCLMLMCKEGNISFLSHDEGIDHSKYLKKSKLHVNSNNSIQIFAKIFLHFW